VRSFGVQIIAALIIGLGLGLVAKYTGSTEANPNGLGATLKIIGSSYVSLLQAAVVPLIFTAVVSSIANLRQVSYAAKLA
jgi:Na+/H+-dicarboxylate symporter